MIVGSAEVVVSANTKPFVAELEGQTRTALAEVEREGKLAGERTGAAMASGVKSGSAAMAAETRAAGAAAGSGLASKLEEGSARSQAALVGVGATGKKVMGGLGLAILGAAAEGVHLAESIQTSEAAIASATGTSIAAAKKIGDALLGTAGKSEFSGAKQAEAYAQVAKQLALTQGRVLSAAQAERFMATSGELAVATNTDLTSATGALAQVMQGYHLQVGQAAHASDVLYSTSKALAIPVTSLAAVLTRLHGRLGDLAPSLTDTAALMTSFAQHGITGSRGAMIVNTALQTLIGGSKKTDAALKALGVSLFDSSGHFVGMRKVIEQLGPKLAGLNQQQRLLAAQMLFGKGAAQAMLGVIASGPSAYDKATAAVNRHGAAQSAAEKQAATLHGQIHTLTATVSDIATVIGLKVIPVVTHMAQAFLGATKYVMEHKAAAVALAAVIGGPLALAIGAFTVNKMAKMVTSVKDAGRELHAMATVAENVAKRVAASFGLQSSAAATNTEKVAAAQAGERAAVTTTATTVQAENTATSRSFTLVGTSTAATATVVEGKVAAEAGAVAAADTAMAAENTAAAASFTSMLGPIGAVAAGLAALHSLNIGGDIHSFLAKFNSQLAAAKAKLDATLTSGLTASAGVPGPPAKPVYSPTAHTGPHTTTTAVHQALTGAGLTPAQRKQFAALLAGTPTSAGSKSGRGATTTAHGFNLAQYNRVYSGHTQLPPSVVRKIAEAAGLPGLTFEQIAHGESSYEPGAIGHDPGGTLGYGLFQNTTGVNGPGFEREVRRLGGWGQMLNPVKNAEAAKWLFDRGGLSHWYGTKYLTAAGRAAASHATVPAMGGPVYVDPLARAHGVVKGRVDQGVDYGFSGPLGALGAGVIESVKTFQGFGKTIVERLTGGPHKGERVYYATETGAIVATHAGAHVKAGQQVAIGRGTGGIEFGFAGPGGLPITRYGPGQSHDVPTRGGLAMESLLHQIATGAYAHSVAGHAVNALTGPQKQLIATEKLVSGQEGAFAKWLAGQRAVESTMTAAQRQALAREVAEKHSALGIQTTAEFAALTTQTRQQKVHLTKMGDDQKVASVLLNKLVAATHTGSLKTLNATLEMAHKAGFSALVKRLGADHVSGFSALSKQLVSVHKTAMAAQTEAVEKAMAAIQKTVDAANKQIVDAGRQHHIDAIGLQAQFDTDSVNAQAQAIQDATKVTLDQQAEVGKTGADLVAAQAQTHLDVVTKQQNALISAAQLNVDRAAAGSDLAKAQAAADLAAAQSSAALSEAQAQAALDLDTAAASAADAATSAADAAGASADTSGASSTTTASSPTFNFVINGHGMTAADLFAEVGWALKTNALPIAAQPSAPVTVAA